MIYAHSCRALWLGLLLLLAVPGSGLHAQSNGDADKPANEMAALIDTIADSRADIALLEQLIAGSEGEIRTVLEQRLEHQRITIVDQINSLGERVASADDGGAKLALERVELLVLMQGLMPDLREQIDDHRDGMLVLMNAEPAATSRAALIHEIRVQKAIDKLIGWYSVFLRSTETMVGNDIDASSERDWLSARLSEAAETLSAAIDIAIGDVDDAGRVISLTPADADAANDLKLATLRLDGLIVNLKALSGLLDAVGLDSSEYRTVILRESGDVSGGLLDRGVLGNLLEAWGTLAWTWARDNSLQWIIKLTILVVILFIARALSKVTRQLVSSGIAKANLSRLLSKMIISVAANAVLVIGVMIALSQLGISVGPVLAGLGVAGIVIGFALQDTLANFASGMMILLYRPYDVGDVIEAGGVFGTVEDMSLVSTIFLTFDNQKLVVPNNKIWGDVIRNVTAQRKRRVDLKFGISYSDDIIKTERILNEIVAADERVLADPEPMIKLHELGESSVDFIVRPWVLTDDYWDVFWDMTRTVKLRFDAEGISIPFPQRDVHLYTAGSSPAAQPLEAQAEQAVSRSHGQDDDD